MILILTNGIDKEKQIAYSGNLLFSLTKHNSPRLGAR